jgi:hypothetical protein
MFGIFENIEGLQAHRLTVMQLRWKNCCPGKPTTYKYASVIHDLDRKFSQPQLIIAFLRCLLNIIERIAK